MELLIIALTIFSIRIFQQILDLQKAFNYFKKNSRIETKNITQNNLIEILIPVYKEKESLIKSILFWNKTDFSPIFITTEREGSVENCESLKLIQILSNFRTIHSPNLTGYKATQLNYAIKTLNLNDNSYYAIFDIDSRPDINVFKYVKENSIEEILQMPSIFTNSVPNYYSYGSAIYQTRRVFSFEIASMLTDFSYLVGHGLFIKSDISNKYNFCEKTITEDLIFGYELSLHKIRPKVLPFLDSSPVPNTISESIKQGSKWFLGDFLMLKYLKFEDIFLTKDIHNILFRYFHIFDWLFGSISIILIFIYGNLYLNIVLWLLIMIFLYIHKRVVEILFQRKFGFREILAVLLRASLNSLAPIYGIYKLIISLFKIESIKFDRTNK